MIQSAPVTDSAIVIVDDEEDATFLLCAGLEKAICPQRIVAFNDARAAVAHFESLAKAGSPAVPLVCFLDIHMPGSNGFDVLRAIRRHRCFDAMPIVMISSSDDSHDVEKARKCGVDCYLVKYPAPDCLQVVLAEAVAFRTGAKARGELFTHPENLILNKQPLRCTQERSTRAFNLQERVAALAKSVALFETAREELLRRRRGAIDSVMVELDEELHVNANTLNLLRRTLELTSRELDAARRN